jgi:GT2 family glycosyltransferase
LLIVDNGSESPLPFGTLYSEENLGFSGGCNVGLRHAKGHAVLFLNNDISLIRETWLEEIREALEPGYLVGPLVNGRWADVDGIPYPWIGGWCLGGMREELLALGGWDESYTEPSYYGDNDLCLRARVEGMTLRDVRVGLRHLENVTAGHQFTPAVQAATTLNRARYQDLARQVGKE